MKKIITIVAAAAMATNITCAQHLDLGVTLGTDGIGIDLSTPVVENWVNVRAGFTYMPRFNATMHFGFEAGDESMTQEERDEQFNKEKFFNVPWVDMLKVKASIGSQGNDNIGDYLYIDTYGISNSNDEIAVVFSNKGNENITWETNTNFNAGVDFDLFQGRLSGSVEGFYRLTSDMLFWFTVPQSLGYSGYYDNIGNMRNAGVEISLNGTLVRTHNVVWDIYANATHYTNKITMLPEERKTVTIEGYSGYSSGNKFIGDDTPASQIIPAVTFKSHLNLTFPT